VQTQAEQIRFSRFLATIRTDVPIRMESLDLAKKDADIEALTRLYQELEFTSLLKKLSPAQDPAPKKTKTAAQGLTLDLFAEEVAPVIKSPEEERREQEARLCSYLLNPEVAFNPAVEPNWEALKADANLWALYEEVELPLMSVLREMEEAGVRIDVAKLKEAEHQLTAELEALEQEIYTMAGTTLNINSPRQVGDLLFETMHLSDKAKKSKTGQYSTSEEVLLGIKDRHPIVGKILDYRELKKLISTYVTSLPGYINPQTGKIHTTYNQTVTATGRLSSSNPNLQNLPIRSERGKLIREAVIPDPGCLFLSADYSQIELRLLAHFSGDEHMQEAFRQGQDIHAATAAKIFRIPIEQVTADQRRRAKTANFGIIYGISAFGLSQQLDCSRAEAKALIDGYFEAFPRVVDYIESQKQKAREKGYAETLFGRRRYLPDILSQNATVRSFAERNAVNAPIQGTAADIIKMAMVSISRRLHMEQLRAQMIMQVHDELNFNVPEDEVERVREIVVGEMQHVVHLSIPLIADCGVGNNWLEAH
jgi:DNA polymerase-1